MRKAASNPARAGPSRLRVEKKKVSAAFARGARAAFTKLITASKFPCVGAKAAWNAGSYVIKTYGRLGSLSTSTLLAAQLLDFTRSAMARKGRLATFVAIFHQPAAPSEKEFEKLLWLQLQRLEEISARSYGWDQSVASDPTHPRFSFSFGGQAFYVVGLHRKSSRVARRFPWPALVFNPHAQFEKLRRNGKWRRMRSVIRERDLALQGSINPMLADFGEISEARQYSGRLVDKSWEAKFRPTPISPDGVCPFSGHR